MWQGSKGERKAGLGAYGLLKGLSPGNLIDRYRNRDVVYLVGENDSDQLTYRCKDAPQGNNRLQQVGSISTI